MSWQRTGVQYFSSGHSGPAIILHDSQVILFSCLKSSHGFPQHMAFNLDSFPGKGLYAHRSSSCLLAPAPPSHSSSLASQTTLLFCLLSSHYWPKSFELAASSARDTLPLEGWLELSLLQPMCLSLHCGIPWSMSPPVTSSISLLHLTLLNSFTLNLFLPQKRSIRAKELSILSTDKCLSYNAENMTDAS